MRERPAHRYEGFSQANAPPAGNGNDPGQVRANAATSPFDFPARGSRAVPPRPALTILEFTPVIKNSLRGFARVAMPSGMILNDVGIYVSAGRAWANPASKPMLDRDCNVLRDAAGKIRYVCLTEFRDRQTRDRFSEAVIAALRLKHPDALP
jgi:hypothetical protein